MSRGMLTQRRPMVRRGWPLALVAAAYVLVVGLVPGGGESLELMGPAALSALGHLLQPQPLLFMVIGVFIGFWVGLLPGLGGPVTMALMLGFVLELKMPPTEAFAFLLGMLAVTATTGDITSVLFGIPGEVVTASTVVEGHPMAKKGEAGRALGAALMSSLVGAWFGALTLLLAIPIVRPLVLSLGSPEFFMLTLLGVAFVGALSGGSVIRGLVAGGLGVMFALVGLDPQTGIQRYTFGQIYLWGSAEGGGGIGLVPAVVGLFAIPEIIDLAVQGGSIARARAGRIGGVLEGVKDTFRHGWLVLQCSAIGSFMGIIPGLGGVAQWVSYAYAMQASGKQDRAGTGVVEGVLGPGAANNSTAGGGLIPTLAFGVPTHSSMAILLAALTILGLKPGQDMLVKRLDLTLSMVWILVLANLVTVGFCFLFLNQLAKITTVRGTLLIPPLLLLIYLGAYTSTNDFGDVLVALAFGLLGWLMLLFDWPRPPLLLGLVLGRLAENYLWISVSAFGLGWLARPGVLIIGCAILAGTLYPLVRQRRLKRVPAVAPGEPERARTFD